MVDGGPQPVVPPTQELYYPDQSVPDPDPCFYRQIAPQPGPDSAAWAGHDPEHGRLWQTWCPDALYLAERDPNGNNVQADTYMGTFYVPDGSPPGQTGVTGDILVARAKGQLVLPTPQPHFGPDATQVAVKVPVWLWVDYDGPIVRTTTAGALTAVVTATLDSTTWAMGDPVDPDHPGADAAPVTCTGAGTPYRAGLDPHHPPCGYTYIWRSLPERTNGTGTWPITVTTHWTISWTVTSGETGSEQHVRASTADLTVREWHVVLVDKPGG